MRTELVNAMCYYLKTYRGTLCQRNRDAHEKLKMIDKITQHESSLVNVWNSLSSEVASSVSECFQGKVGQAFECVLF